MNDIKKIITLVLNCIWVLSFLPALGVSQMSIMIFDAPGSQDSTFTIMLFLSIVSFPIMTLIAVIGSIICFIIKKTKAAFIISLLPFISVIMTIISLILITVICDGSFSCR